MTAKQILKSVVPPVLWDLTRRSCRRATGADSIVYAPSGWDTAVQVDAWSDAEWADHLGRDRLEGEAFRHALERGESLVAPNPDGQLNYMTFGYVLASIACGKSTLRILDYGGGLGDYYWAARFLMPDVALDYHCKEVPAFVAEGQRLAPEIVWHTTDDCLGREYDLVMFVSSIQYLPNWQQLLHRAAIVAPHLFLSFTPTVEDTAGYVAIQLDRKRASLFQALSRREVIAVARDAGMGLVQSFTYGTHPPVKNAPEQPSYGGWLFRRARDG